MWDQPNLFSQLDHPYSVSEITARIRALLEREPALQDFWVEGEVSNFSRASSGHIYFTLKDAGAQLGGVIWRSQVQRMHYLPKTGDRVLAHGRIGIYEQGGRYQFYADRLQPAGKGDLYAEFERLKARLDAEGLFDAVRKRALPAFPQRIGVVTSPTTAALRDVLHVLSRRYPLVEVLLSPTLVQGDAAPLQIVAALDILNSREDVDVILIARGGGSLEDLWAFNDERVARAVAASRLPVVSGVGHEIDFTLTDFAADVRAPTPSAAAEVATPDIAELRAGLSQELARLDRACETRIRSWREHIAQLGRGLEHLSPAMRIASARQRVDDLAARCDLAITHEMDTYRQKVAWLVSRLKSVNPETVLARGYAIVRAQETGLLVTSRMQLKPGMALSLHLQDGEVLVNVAASGEVPLD